MKIESIITQGVSDAVKALYGLDFPADKIQPQQTKKEFEGNLTIMAFPFLKASHKSPEATATEIGEWLVENVPAKKISRLTSRIRKKPADFICYPLRMEIITCQGHRPV